MHSKSFSPKSTIVCLLLMVSMVAVLAAAPSHVEPDKALQLLKEGNQRYVKGQNTVLERSKDRPAELDSGQAPFAAIVSCADSRVDPLLAFDAAWGDLFITRVAGNLSEPYIVGSNEFAHAVLGTRLMVVLGHERCGAVVAALGPDNIEGPLGKVVEFIRPAVKGYRADQVKEATEANVRYGMAQITEQSPMLKKAVAEGKLKIVGAIYMFETGEVRFLP